MVHGNEIITEAITVATKKINKPYIGDYVNYTPQSDVIKYSVTSEQSGYGDQTIKQNNTNKWRILNINKDTVDLICEKSSMTGGILYITGATGYNNGVYLLNDMCKTLYSNERYSATARNIRIEDIQDKMDLSYWDYHSYSKEGVQYGNIIEYSGTVTYPDLWIKENSEKNAINGILTNGTLKQSEDLGEFGTGKTTTDNTSITLTQTGWENKKMTELNFKTAVTRNSKNDTRIFFELFISGGVNYSNNYYIASRYVDRKAESLFEYKADFGIFLARNYSDRDFIIEYKNSLVHLNTTNRSGISATLCPIVTIPYEMIELTTEYDTTGIWNLK